MSDISFAIPASWVLTPIAELLAPLEDGRVLHHGWSPQCQKVPAKTEHEWGVLKTTSVQPGAFHSEHNKRLPEKLAPRHHLEVRPGDLLLTCAGPRARCGVPCMVRETRPRLILSGKMYRFRAQQGLIEPRYLEAYLLASAAQAAIDRMKTGISDSGLNLTHGRFKKLEVVLAPFREQQRIVEAIESYFTRLDDVVATLQRVQRNLKRYRASVLKAAVEGRLVPAEAELARAEGRDYEPASVLLERILAERRRRWEETELARMQAKGRAPTDDKWKAKYMEPESAPRTDLPELPEGWLWVRLSALIASGPQNGVYVPKSQYGGGTPILRIDDYQTDWSRSSGDLRKIAIPEADAEKYALSVGDIVVNRVNSPSHLGKSLAVRERHLPAVFESNMMRLALAEAIVPSYIQHYLSSSSGKRRLTESAKWAVNQASINQGDVGATLVPLPPKREQQRIIAEVEHLLSAAEDTAAATMTSASRCGRLRQSILKWAFEGRLVDQDPTDEPASRLLERIQAGREAKPARPPRTRRRTRATEDRP